MTVYTETTDCIEIAENYKSLLNMCDLKTAADAIIHRVDEMDERMIEDVMFTLRGELKLRLIGEYK